MEKLIRSADSVTILGVSEDRVVSLLLASRDVEAHILAVWCIIGLRPDDQDTGEAETWWAHSLIRALAKAVRTNRDLLPLWQEGFQIVFELDAPISLLTCAKARYFERVAKDWKIALRVFDAPYHQPQVESNTGKIVRKREDFALGVAEIAPHGKGQLPRESVPREDYIALGSKTLECYIDPSQGGRSHDDIKNLCSEIERRSPVDVRLLSARQIGAARYIKVAREVKLRRRKWSTGLHTTK